MEIKITSDGRELQIDDRMLDNDAFIAITMKATDSGDIVSGDFSLREVMSALIAFDAQRSKRLSEEDGD